MMPVVVSQVQGVKLHLLGTPSKVEMVALILYIARLLSVLAFLQIFPYFNLYAL